MKRCEFCNSSLFRKRKPCGKLESNKSFLVRRFCNSKCRGNATASKNQCLESSARQRTLKLFPKASLKCCNICGNYKEKLQRHHIDKNLFNNNVDNILICCQKCHVKEHQKNDKWGKGKKDRFCKCCLKKFIHTNRRRRTCSKECFLNICTTIAKKRWESEKN